jgi:hypothetical protein
MNVELPETLVILESVVYKSNGFAISCINKSKKKQTKNPEPTVT